MTGAAAEPGWSMPGIPEIRGSHRYGFVFLTVLGTFVLLSAGGDSIGVRIGAVALQTLTLILVFYTGGVAKNVRRLVLAILLTGGLVVGLSFLGSTDVTKGTAGIVNAVFVLTAVIGIVRGLRRQSTIDVKTVMGALSIYLLLGLFFAWTYSAISALGNDLFFAAGQTDTIAHFLYFSYITQTTVGYGDFVASGNLGRTVAVVQALLGQIYLVTIVGVTVSRLGMASRVAGGRPPEA